MSNYRRAPRPRCQFCGCIKRHGLDRTPRAAAEPPACSKCGEHHYSRSAASYGTPPALERETIRSPEADEHALCDERIATLERNMHRACEQVEELAEATLRRMQADIDAGGSEP